MHIPTGSTMFVYGKITLMIHSIFILHYKIIHISNILKGVLSLIIIYSPLYTPLMYVYMVLSLLGLDLVNSILIIIFPLPFQKIQTRL